MKRIKNTDLNKLIAIRTVELEASYMPEYDALIAEYDELMKRLEASYMPEYDELMKRLEALNEKHLETLQLVDILNENRFYGIKVYAKPDSVESIERVLKYTVSDLPVLRKSYCLNSWKLGL